MAKKNKRKKNISQNRKSMKSYFTITKTYFDEYSRVARKFMLLIGLKEADYDALSKRTKEHLMFVKHSPYRIKAEKGSHVSRYYIKFFNYVTAEYERKTFYGDPKFNIRYVEYLTYGLSLIFSIRNYDTDDNYWTDDQIELLEKIKTPLVQFTTENEQDHYAIRANEILKYLFMYVSQPNFRYYTYKEAGRPIYSKGIFENLLIVSSIESEIKRFVIDGKSHPAYRLQYYSMYPDVDGTAPEKAYLDIDLLLNTNSNSSTLVLNSENTANLIPVYIQTHALNRASERMDCKSNLYRNQVFSMSFMFPQIITAYNGQKLIKAIDIKGKTVGYFPYTIKDGAILLLSFLPLCSPITPEGAVLLKELDMQVEDSKFLGLDKFSFYTNTDFDTIPKVKQALQKADMWHLTEILPDVETERKEDKILKHIFDSS